MKKALCVICVALLVLVATVSAYTTVDNRTLKNSLEYENIGIFIPSGMANEYKDLLTMTFDDHRIWKYDLNGKEAVQMTENLKNGIWKKLPDNAKDLEWYLPYGYGPDKLNEEIYFCLYQPDKKEYDYDISGPGMPSRIFFLYDAETQTYYCVSKAI